MSEMNAMLQDMYFGSRVDDVHIEDETDGRGKLFLASFVF